MAGSLLGSRLIDTCLLLHTIHFLEVIYERTSLIRDGFICPLLQVTDAAAKMPGPCCLKGCTPTPSQMLLHFSRTFSSLASWLYSPTLNPICSRSCNPSRRFKSTKTVAPGQWEALAGEFGEHHLPGATFVAFPC